MKDEEIKSPYFDKWQLDQIWKKSRVDYLLAMEQMKNYIMEYPYDYIGYVRYINMLLDIGKNEEAIKLYNSISYDDFLINSINKDGTEKKLEIYKRESDKIKVRLLILEKNFLEAYELYNKLFFEPDLIKIYLAKNAEIELPNILRFDSYLKSQILDYSDERFLEHIEPHTYLKEHDGNCFTEDFPIYEIFFKIKQITPNDKRFSYGLLDDKYYFKYNLCGYYKNVLTDYFTLITISNTNHFITMYPCDDTMNLPYIDLNDYRKENDGGRKISQIEKFNKKYNIK